MSTSLATDLIFLLLGIGVIVILTAVYRVHAFFALLVACFVVGLGIGMPVATIIDTVKDGFGGIMRSLGLIIVLGTTLGVLLEYSGSSRVMAEFILRKAGKKYAAFGMSLTGLIVGLPIFCDSGFIVLSGLNLSLAKRTGIPVIIMSVSMATGLLSVHCLIPPHPGATAAAVTIGVDFGKLMMAGTALAIPAMLVGHWWARFAGKKTAPQMSTAISADPVVAGPSVVRAFLPVIVPILLIAARSFAITGKQVPGAAGSSILMLGEPVIALAVGVLLACSTGGIMKRHTMSGLLQDAAEKAGGILVIIGAGGAFGAVLAAGRIGQQFSNALPLSDLGILFPFLLTFLLKTAQGSSTVAIITAASIVQPLLHVLGLDTETGRLFCVLSMGAGSMMISHANDAYFWVIAKFSGIDMKSMLRVYSMATVWMGLVSFALLYLVFLMVK